MCKNRTVRQSRLIVTPSTLNGRRNSVLCHLALDVGHQGVDFVSRELSDFVEVHCVLVRHGTEKITGKMGRKLQGLGGKRKQRGTLVTTSPHHTGLRVIHIEKRAPDWPSDL
jgi:hypothetical protein